MSDIIKKESDVIIKTQFKQFLKETYQRYFVVIDKSIFKSDEADGIRLELGRVLTESADIKYAFGLIVEQYEVVIPTLTLADAKAMADRLHEIFKGREANTLFKKAWETESPVIAMSKVDDEVYKPGVKESKVDSVAGKKVFKVGPSPVGTAKYIIRHYDGVQKHPDGSQFWGIKIYHTKKELAQGIEDFKQQGYVEESNKQEEKYGGKVMCDACGEEACEHSMIEHGPYIVCPDCFDHYTKEELDKIFGLEQKKVANEGELENKKFTSIEDTGESENDLIDFDPNKE